MKYINAVQNPIILDDKVIGWELKITAEQQNVTGSVEEIVNFEEKDYKPISYWTPQELAKLLNKISSERNMLYRAAEKVTNNIKELSGNT